MKVYEGKDIRNVGVVGHGHCGKTMLTSALLYTAGAVNRLTRPDEGNTVTDFDEEEIQRKFTMSTAVAVAEWKKTKINLLDTPGFNIFIQDTRAALRRGRRRADRHGWRGGRGSPDGEGLQLRRRVPPATRVLHQQARSRARGLSADASSNIHEMFGRACVPIQLPIGSEKNFKGVVDLISMKAYTYTPNGDGKGKEGPIPADMADAAKEAHEALVEIIAEGNDELMEEFFDKGTLPEEHMIDGLREATAKDKLFPILCGSAHQNIGTDLLLNFLVDYFPSAIQHDPVHATAGDQRVDRTIADERAAICICIQDNGRPVCRAGHVLQGLFGRA